jgi:prefoldin subunit 5
LQSQYTSKKADYDKTIADQSALKIQITSAQSDVANYTQKDKDLTAKIAYDNNQITSTNEKISAADIAIKEAQGNVCPTTEISCNNNIDDDRDGAQDCDDTDCANDVACVKWEGTTVDSTAAPTNEPFNPDFVRCAVDEAELSNQKMSLQQLIADNQVAINNFQNDIQFLEDRMQDIKDYANQTGKLPPDKKSSYDSMLAKKSQDQAAVSAREFAIKNLQSQIDALKICPDKIQNPKCSTAHYNCEVGESIENSVNTTEYIWQCSSVFPSGERLNVSCSEAKSDLPGCTDSRANNYNPAANKDDGSCVYPEVCNNTVDDDKNNLIDCSDPACSNDPSCLDTKMLYDGDPNVNNPCLRDKHLYEDQLAILQQQLNDDNDSVNTNTQLIAFLRDQVASNEQFIQNNPDDNDQSGVKNSDVQNTINSYNDRITTTQLLINKLNNEIQDLAAKISSLQFTLNQLNQQCII